MRELAALLIVLVFAGLATSHCQEASNGGGVSSGKFDQTSNTLLYSVDDPDAPSTAQPPAPPVKLGVWGSFKRSWQTQWDPTVPMAPVWSPFKSPMFVISAGVLVAATLGDVIVSQHDFNNGCGEAHDAGRRPPFAEQMSENLALDAFVIGGSYFLKRKHIKILPESFMLLGTGRHAYGMYKAVNSPCY